MHARHWSSQEQDGWTSAETTEGGCHANRWLCDGVWKRGVCISMNSTKFSSCWLLWHICLAHVFGGQTNTEYLVVIFKVLKVPCKPIRSPLIQSQICSPLSLMCIVRDCISITNNLQKNKYKKGPRFWFWVVFHFTPSIWLKSRTAKWRRYPRIGSKSVGKDASILI